MAERITDSYPEPLGISETLRQKSTLYAWRRFYASEGGLVFAATMDGMANMSEGVWLRPCAYRRLGHYLDLHVNDAISGYTIVRTGQHLQGTVPEELFDDFREIAGASINTVVDAKRDIRLAGISDVGVSSWPWHGTVMYRYVITLADGSRLTDQVRVPVLAKPSQDGAEVDIAVVSWRSADIKAAVAWLNKLAGDTQGSIETAWQRDNIHLDVADADERLAELVRIFNGLGGGTLVGMRDPEVRGRGDVDAADARFSDLVNTARYDTQITTRIELIEEAMRRDRGFVSGLDGFTHVPDMQLLENGKLYDPVICLRVKQPDKSAPMQLQWRTGKRVDKGTDLSVFSAAMWDRIRSIEWTPDEKWHFLARAWAFLLDAHRGCAAGEATAASA
jgi:hypothetical protein